MIKETKDKILSLLDEANDLLYAHLDLEDDDNEDGILCPLGEVINNVYDLEVEDK